MTSLTPTLKSLPDYVRDGSTCGLRFNVMPDRPVEETLHLEEYRVWDRYVEAQFDRTYMSSMEKSPDHLVFLTALAHTQKMLYLAMCREFGFDYDPNGTEQLKIWPTKVGVKMPKLCSQAKGVVQELRVLEVKKFTDTTYKVKLESRVGDALIITAEAPVYLLAAARREVA